MDIELSPATGNFEITPGPGEDVRDIAAAVIVSSYENGDPVGMGTLRAHWTQLTKEMALRMLDGEDVSHDYPGASPNKKDSVYMDYVFGRCCKTMVKIVDGKVVGRISTRDRDPVVILQAVEKGEF